MIDHSMSEEQFLYLITTGWKTGNPHKIEIWFVEYAENYYIVSEKRARAHWVQNIQHNPRVQFYVATRTAGSPIIRSGIARFINPTLESDLATRITILMREKYGWSNGLPVELRTLTL